MATNAGTNTLSVSEETQAQLAKIASVGYSLSGFPPTKSEWELTENQICEIIKTHTKAYLEDVQDVTIEHDRRNGALYAFIWIPSESKHVCDHVLQNGNSAVSKTMKRYSPKLKEYMDKFCQKDRRRTVSENGNLPLVGVEVMIERFLQIGFDEAGNGFGKLVGDAFRRRTQIRLKPIYDTRGNGGQFDKLRFVRVSKSLKNRNAYTGKPTPRKSFNG